MIHTAIFYLLLAIQIQTHKVWSMCIEVLPIIYLSLSLAHLLTVWMSLAFQNKLTTTKIINKIPNKFLHGIKFDDCGDVNAACNMGDARTHGTKHNGIKQKWDHTDNGSSKHILIQLKTCRQKISDSKYSIQLLMLLIKFLHFCTHLTE